jgi:CDP-diacylglycerol--glycerol-3-phosphate 3-phosphatidyltransferase
VKITANQVTFVRLALIPIPGWLLYRGVSGQYAALVLATILGCTDFVDGYLARKHGSTVLGSLMDPIADKVFTAACFLPAVDLGWLPPWMVAALFVREFFVTAARTSYEGRGLQLKSSYLARYKTWVQMCGIGVLFLLGAAPEQAMDIFFGVLAIAPLVFFVLRYLLVKKMWKGAAAFTVTLTSFWIVHRIWGAHATAILLGWYILAITYASGLGYLFSVGKLKGRGVVTAGDIVRLTTSVAMPIVAVWAQTTGRAPSWAIIALVSIELAHGGLDNLLAHHKAEASAVSWGVRLVAECALLFAVTQLAHDAATMVTVAALAVGAVGIVTAFVQKRRYYLEPKIAGEALSAPRVAV